MKKFLIGLALTLASASSYAASVAHTGVILNIYFNDAGQFAVKFHTAFEDAAIMECPNFNGFAGGRTSSLGTERGGGSGTNFDRASHLQDLLLDSYKNQTPITIVTNGCTGNWIHIRSAIGTAPPPST